MCVCVCVCVCVKTGVWCKCRRLVNLSKVFLIRCTWKHHSTHVNIECHIDSVKTFLFELVYASHVYTQSGDVFVLGPFSLSPTEFHLQHNHSTTFKVNNILMQHCMCACVLTVILYMSVAYTVCMYMLHVYVHIVYNCCTLFKMCTFRWVSTENVHCHVYKSTAAVILYKPADSYSVCLCR